MNAIKRLAALLLALAALTLVFPAGAADGPASRGVHPGVILDTDPDGGYEGDYVVIYNPSSSTASGAATGSLAGKIETSVGGSSAAPAPVCDDARGPKVDIGPRLRLYAPKAVSPVPERTDWGVGATKDFDIRFLSPAGTSGNIRFKVLYVGAHCRVWTPVNADYRPLDGIDPSYAALAGAEFDSKFGVMKSSFGDFRDTNGDGRVNILFYNIDDGWTPGSSYTAGYFWSGDFYYNSLPMIHIDTYPGILYTGTNGQAHSDITECYGTLVHEFQHLINYSVTGGMHTWLDESFAGAAEEICYPGVGLFSRIQDWQGYYYTTVGELFDPAEEIAYRPDFKLHKGGSIAYWNDDDADLLSRYAGVMFFSQYLYSSFGSTSVFRSISENCEGSGLGDSLEALEAGTGRPLAEIWRDFAVSMAANSYPSGYGFRMNPGYDPSGFWGVEDIYSLLPAVIYTSTASASIQGGGFITVKPRGGMFTPPSGASDKLRYVGIRFTEHIPGDVNGDGVIDTEDALTALRGALGIAVLPPEERMRADIDSNGTLDTEDALRILRIALGIH